MVKVCKIKVEAEPNIDFSNNHSLLFVVWVGHEYKMFDLNFGLLGSTNECSGITSHTIAVKTVQPNIIIIFQTSIPKNITLIANSSKIYNKENWKSKAKLLNG